MTDVQFPGIRVELSYEQFSSDKKMIRLRSILKSKKKAASAKNKGKLIKKATPKTKLNEGKKGKQKKRGRKKKKVHVEVTSVTEEVLEKPEDLDQTYQELKEKIISKFNEENLEICHVTRSATLEQKIETIANSGCDTFYLVDITTIILKYKYFKEFLPRVKPFYAVKCNPDPYILHTLVTCGAGLDVASMMEIQKGITAKQSPENIIFANPCKMPEHLRFAKDSGVTKMTFDNAAELRKIQKIFPEAETVLRILSDDSHSTMRFGSKFGADVNKEVRSLLELAYELGLRVIGVSFHVGSGCQSGEAYSNTLLLARKAFDIAEELGHPMHFLDIGGGFLGTDTETVCFENIARSISSTLDELFPSEVTVIAEPGRYFASECVVLVTTVIARREREHENPETGENETFVDYYISDGVYGSFNNMFFDYYKPTPVPLGKKQEQNVNDENSEQLSEYRSTLFGPTCDSIDVVCKDIELPELEIGDHVYFFNMGAYSAAAASHFNGFTPPKSYYIIS